MALAINNRVRETTATTGTGAVTLAGAVDGFQTFAAGIGNSNTTYYAISLNTANEWEVGLGTLNGDSSTLTRTTVLESSNGDAAVDFAAGSKEVFCTLPSEKALYLDASGALANATVITDANINASGTASSTTFLRGDNSWTAISGGSITTAGETFDNYNEISSSVDTTLVATKNYMLVGAIDVSGSAVWDVKGSGVLTII
jgi:hypothetical protein